MTVMRQHIVTDEQDSDGRVAPNQRGDSGIGWSPVGNPPLDDNNLGIVLSDAAEGAPPAQRIEGIYKVLATHLERRSAGIPISATGEQPARILTLE
jgi:hypothetical protein